MSKSNSTILKNSIVIAVIHCLLGNIWGIYSERNLSFNIYQWLVNIIDFVFLPYSFIAGMSEYAGWDKLSYYLDAIGLLCSILILFVIFKVRGKLRKS